MNLVLEERPFNSDSPAHVLFGPHCPFPASRALRWLGAFSHLLVFTLAENRSHGVPLSCGRASSVLSSPAGLTLWLLDLHLLNWIS